MKWWNFLIHKTQFILFELLYCRQAIRAVLHWAIYSLTSHHITHIVPADSNKIRNAVCREPGRVMQETKTGGNWVMHMQANANFIKSHSLWKLILLQMLEENESIKNIWIIYRIGRQKSRVIIPWIMSGTQNLVNKDFLWHNSYDRVEEGREPSINCVSRSQSKYREGYICIYKVTNLS